MQRTRAFLSLILVLFSARGTIVHPPQTVVDYYLLLPPNYFYGLASDTRKERMHLLERPGGIVDGDNGYLHVNGDSALRELTVCLFRYPNGDYLAALSSNRGTDGRWDPTLGFFRYRHGRLADVTSIVRPSTISRRLRVRLPRHGRTMRVINAKGQTISMLQWTGQRFQLQRASR
jgi:hypothetical protein